MVMLGIMITPKTPHILVVDDNAEIRETLGAYLRRNGKRATTAADAAAARDALKRMRVDLVVLDIMMPGEDGLSLCRSLAGKDGPPVLLLSARGEDIDRIVGLEVGADDYVPKPFNPRELLARIDAIIRRDQAPPRQSRKLQEGRVKIGDWVMNSGDLFLTHSNGERMYLSSTEMRLLEVFIERPGVVLDRDALLDLSHVQGLQISERAIDSQVSRLRRKLGDNPKETRYIRTVWGGGYTFTVQAERL
jgi:two-component system, OmpR family, response regulator